MTDARPSGWEQKESATWCSNTHHWSDEHNDDHHLVAVYKVRDKEMNKERGKEMTKDMDKKMNKGMGKERSKERGKEMNKERDKKMNKERDKEMNKERDKEMNKERGKEMNKERDKEMNKEREKEMNKQRDKETDKERARKEKCCAMATSVVGGSDEQNDVSDGADPSWWRPLTECRPLYSTQQCTRPMITNTNSNTMQSQIQLHRQKRLMIISTMLPIILNTSMQTHTCS